MGKIEPKGKGKLPTVEKTAAKLPTDEQLAKERADQQRRDALAKARDNKKAKAEAEKQDEITVTKKPSLLYLNGCKQLSKLLYLISRPIAWLCGYRLTPLESKELDELAAELVPLTARFKWLILVLGFVAFPLLFVELIEKHAVPRPKKPAKEQPKPSTPAAEVVAFSKREPSPPAVTLNGAEDVDPGAIADELAGDVSTESNAERVQ